MYDVCSQPQALHSIKSEPCHLTIGDLAMAYFIRPSTDLLQDGANQSSPSRILMSIGA